MESIAPLDRLRELFTKVDVFFERAKARHGEAIVCKAGCDDCCRRRFSVTSIEAEVIRAHVARLSPSERRAIAARAADAESSICPALGEGGRCAIYEVRPLICRSHGLPIRFDAMEGGRRLPMIDACPKNFVGLDLASTDATSVLDQSTLSTILGALDAAFADASDLPRGERVAMEEALSGVPRRTDSG